MLWSGVGFFYSGPFKPALKLHWASLSRLFISYDGFKIIFGLGLFLVTKLVLFFVCFLVFYLFSRLMLSLAKGCLFILVFPYVFFQVSLSDKLYTFMHQLWLNHAPIGELF